MVPKAFSGGQPKLLRDLRPIHVTLMTKVEQAGVQWSRCRRGDGYLFHARYSTPDGSPGKAEYRTGGVCVARSMSVRTLTRFKNLGVTVPER
jgi:hypothetical protein